MGSLILPASGSVYVDTQVLIYTVERHPIYLPILDPLWRAARTRALNVTTSELSLLECMVLPIRIGDTALQNMYEHALLRTELRLVPVSQSILLDAARLRATKTGLRTPDAIHAATAVASGCVMLVTNDEDLRRVPGIQVTVLKDLRGP